MTRCNLIVWSALLHAGFYSQLSFITWRRESIVTARHACSSSRLADRGSDLDGGEGPCEQTDDVVEELDDYAEDDRSRRDDAAAAAASSGVQELQRRGQRPRGAAQGHVAGDQRGGHRHLALAAQQGVEHSCDRQVGNRAHAHVEGPGGARRCGGHHGAAAQRLHGGVWPWPDTDMIDSYSGLRKI